MENSPEEQQLLALFRKLPPHQRQELLAIAQGLATDPPAATGQCAINSHVFRAPVENDVLVTE